MQVTFDVGPEDAALLAAVYDLLIYDTLSDNNGQWREKGPTHATLRLLPDVVERIGAGLNISRLIWASHRLPGRQDEVDLPFLADRVGWNENTARIVKALVDAAFDDTPRPNRQKALDLPQPTPGDPWEVWVDAGDHNARLVGHAVRHFGGIGGWGFPVVHFDLRNDPVVTFSASVLDTAFPQHCTVELRQPPHLRAPGAPIYCWRLAGFEMSTWATNDSVMLGPSVGINGTCLSMTYMPASGGQSGESSPQ